MWSSGMKDMVPIADAMKMWMTDFDYYDNINQAAGVQKK